MRVTFLGTSGAVPTPARAPSAVLVNREGERFLFDAGEGTQRQMMRFNTGFGVSHVFVTHLHGDHILGLPGLVQSWDFNDRSDALAIHGPPGSRRRLKELVRAGGYSPGFPIRVAEASPGSVALSGDGFEVRAFETDHETQSVGYALVEDERPGRFDRARAEELGVPVGPEFGRLHAGETVELDDGREVRPEQVVGPPRPGRRVVYTGDTRPAAATEEAAADADLLIHDATFGDEEAGRAGQTGHSTAREAAGVAARAGAKRLALTHLSSRYAAETGRLVREAAGTFGEAVALRDLEAGDDDGVVPAVGSVFVPDDGDTVRVPYPDDESTGE